MKRPRYVLLFSKIVEKMNNISISNRLMEAIIEPIIDSQFLDVGGNFMLIGFKEFNRVNIKKISIFLTFII